MNDFPISRRRLVGAAAAMAASTLLPSTPTRAQGPRKLVFWHTYTQPARSEFLRAAANRFQAMNPGLTIEIESTPFPTVPQRWPAAMQAGTLPDLMIHGADTAIPMFLAGALHPVDDVIKSIGGPDVFLPGLLDRTSKYRGQYLSIPHYVHSRILIYRKDRLAAAGLKPPVTWDDTLKVAVATTKAPDYYGWILKLNKNDVAGTYLLYPLVRSAGGGFYDADGKVTFMSAPVKEAVQFMTEVARQASGPGVADYNTNDNFNLVNSGKTTLAEDSASIVAGAAVNAPQVAEQLDATDMPRKTTPASLLISLSFFLPKGKNPDDAKAFLRYLYSDENYLPFLHTIPLFMFPTTRKASGPAFFQHPTIQRFRNVVDVSMRGLESSTMFCMENGLNPFAAPVSAAHIVEEMFHRILIDKQPIDQAMGVAAKTMEDTIRGVQRRLRPS